MRRFAAPGPSARSSAWILLGLLLLALPARAGWDEDYVEGKELLRKGKVGEAVDRLRSCAKNRPIEAAQVPTARGVGWILDYYPHYYLGVALSADGDCEKAELAWAESVRQGAAPDWVLESIDAGRAACSARRGDPPPPSVRRPKPPEPQPVAVAPPPAPVAQPPAAVVQPVAVAPPSQPIAPAVAAPAEPVSPPAPADDRDRYATGRCCIGTGCMDGLLRVSTCPGDFAEGQTCHTAPCLLLGSKASGPAQPVGSGPPPLTLRRADAGPASTAPAVAAPIAPAARPAVATPAAVATPVAAETLAAVETPAADVAPAADDAEYGLDRPAAPEAPPRSGACCAFGSCDVMPPGDCAAIGGEYRGDDTSCDGQCAPGFLEGTGACCIGGACVVLTPERCADQGGSFAGRGTSCAREPCASAAPKRGAPREPAPGSPAPAERGAPAATSLAKAERMLFFGEGAKSAREASEATIGMLDATTGQSLDEQARSNALLALANFNLWQLADTASEAADLESRATRHAALALQAGLDVDLLDPARYPPHFRRWLGRQ